LYANISKVPKNSKLTSLVPMSKGKYILKAILYVEAASN